MSRHGSLAEQLAALKAFVNRPEGEVEPIQTNWSVVAANDNNPEDYADVHTERRVSIRPTLPEIERQVKDGAEERGAASTMEVFVDKEWKTVEVPGPITRIGKLQFSDGTQTERCMMAGIDGEPVVGQIRMPVGAMLNTKEVQERQLGGSGVSPGESNAWFCEAFDVDNRQYIAGGKRRKGQNYTRDEAAEMLAKAIANTPVMPDVYYCEDGIALGTARVADNFIGMKKSPKGNGGAIAWQDLSDKIAEREIFIEAERQLDTKDRDVLQAAKTARSMSDIGGSGHKRSAEKRGRRYLLAANDNLAIVIKKLSA